MYNITIKDMFNSNVHFGHLTYLWNPKMKKFIFGKKNKIHIFNLKKTLFLYKKALKFIKKISSNEGDILYVCTKKKLRDIVISEAKRSKSPYVCQRWLGGTLTNFKTIILSIQKIFNIKCKFQNYLNRKNKKKFNLKKKIKKFEKNMGGIKNINKMPKALFIIDVKYHKNAVIEANKLKIPIIAIVDSDSNPDNIDYIIPGNDDSIKATTLYLKYISNIIIKNKINN